MSAIPGQYNELEMVKYTDFGIYLDGGDMGEILMPTKYVPHNTNRGDKVRCFVYYDTTDRPIATTETPKATVGQCAYLKCVAVTKFGAFLDWGLTKDLLVPFREQKMDMVEGKSYVVYIYLDEKSRRIVASAKLDKYLNKQKPTFEEGDKVELIIASASEQGLTAVINGTHTGLLYRNEIFQPLHPGEVVTGYIKEIRGDGKIDLALQQTGYKNLLTLDDQVLDVIKSHGGFMKVGDKTAPEDIYTLFQMSKKNWKKIIGNLYKNRKIDITDGGIKLL